MDRCSLGIVGSYKHFEIAFRYKGIDFSDKKENFNVSEKFIPYLDNLFKQHFITINNLDFIALDQGPGAFTSLRATIASCNGLSFASGVHLIGIDGLDALSKEVFEKNLDFLKTDFDEKLILIALLNAYNNDVYYAINEVVSTNGGIELVLLEPKSYRNINEFLGYISSKYNSYKFLFCGNGFTLHKSLIFEKLKKDVIDKTFSEEVCSAKFVLDLGQKGFERNENLSRKLLPLYLKTQQFKPQIKSL